MSILALEPAARMSGAELAPQLSAKRWEVNDVRHAE
jgi:hypothetical protein